jgi:hypothetical protein
MKAVTNNGVSAWNCPPDILVFRIFRITGQINMFAEAAFAKISPAEGPNLLGFLSHIEIGGPCRDRTYDQRIKSPVLYQLS